MKKINKQPDINYLKNYEDSFDEVQLDLIRDEINTNEVKGEFQIEEWSAINLYMMIGDITKTFLKIFKPKTKKEARQMAIDFFGQDKIKNEINRRYTIIQNQHLNLIHKLYQEYSSIAFVNLDDFIEWKDYSVKLKPSSELTRLQKAGIAEIKHTKYGIQFKLHNKLHGLDSLSKIIGIMRDTIDLKSSDGSMSPVNGQGNVVILPDNHRGSDEENN